MGVGYGHVASFNSLGDRVLDFWFSQIKNFGRRTNQGFKEA